MTEVTNPKLSKTIGKADKGSREQAVSAANKNLPCLVPCASDGFPLVRISISAAELIPTGQFANVSIGPALIEAYIDPREPEAFGPDQLSNIAKALNELALVVESDVVAVQRNLVLESIQEQQK